LHFDYTTVGHVTIDLLDDGSRRAGGTAFYSALQAARLGLRTLIVTQGLPAEIEQLLEPYRGELELTILPAPSTTTLLTAGSGSDRAQRVLAWAGPIAEDLVLDTAILHLAPIARETPSRWRGPAAFVGLTPQGLVRQWHAGGAGGGADHSASDADDDAGDPGDGRITNAPPADGAVGVAERCHALVVSEHERASCAGLIAAARAAGAVVAVTAGAEPVSILAPGHEVDRQGGQGGELAGGRDNVDELQVPVLHEPVDDLGAGDVFAAAFFVCVNEGRSALDAARFANAAAAVRMHGAGAGAIGGRGAIEARLHSTIGAGGLL
jgi:1D-myo-inositol 3-kinase